MKELYFTASIETMTILIIALFINQVLHRFFTKIKLNFITPILNIFIVIWFLITYHSTIDKISHIPNIYFPIENSKLLLIANITAGILIFIFIIQCIKNIIKQIKINNKENGYDVTTEELPKFKDGIDLSYHEEKEYPLPAELKYKSCPICDAKNTEDAIECTSCHRPIVDEKDKKLLFHKKLKKRQ